MNKEELNKIVSEQKDIISQANKKIKKAAEEYINSLPIKVNDKCQNSRGEIFWICEINVESSYGNLTGNIKVKVNYAKKDGTRSNRKQYLYCNIENVTKI